MVKRYNSKGTMHFKKELKDIQLPITTQRIIKLIIIFTTHTFYAKLPPKQTGELR